MPDALIQSFFYVTIGWILKWFLSVSLGMQMMAFIFSFYLYLRVFVRYISISGMSNL